MHLKTILRYSSTQKWFLERAQTVTSRSHLGFYIGCILKMAGSHIWVFMQIRWPSLQCAQSCCISLSNGRHTNGRKQIRGYLFKQGRCISRGMHAYGSFCLQIENIWIVLGIYERNTLPWEISEFKRSILESDMKANKMLENKTQ